MHQELSGLYHENLYRLLELQKQPEEDGGALALHMVFEAPAENDQTLDKFMSGVPLFLSLMDTHHHL